MRLVSRPFQVLNLVDSFNTVREETENWKVIMG